MCFFFFCQAENGIRDLVRSRGLGDVYKRQAANFRTERRIPVERIPYALNAHLPPAIRVRAAADMPPEFHALRTVSYTHLTLPTIYPV